jgi:hypothetical protein
MDIKKHGPMEHRDEQSWLRPMNVACPSCGDEILLSLSRWHNDRPEVRCHGCGAVGYLKDGTIDGGTIRWFRKPNAKDHPQSERE